MQVVVAPEKRYPVRAAFFERDYLLQSGKGLLDSNPLLRVWVKIVSKKDKCLLGILIHGFSPKRPPVNIRYDDKL